MKSKKQWIDILCSHGKCSVRATVRRCVCVHMVNVVCRPHDVCSHGKCGVQATVRMCSRGKCGMQATVRMCIHVVNVDCRPQ